MRRAGRRASISRAAFLVCAPGLTIKDRLRVLQPNDPDSYYADREIVPSDMSDIDLLPEKDGKLRVKVKGVDAFKPQTGEVISDNADGIACWFIDTDYNEESFFVRHAYFLGANDPYNALKTTLKAEVDAEAWATLHSDTSRPFDKPKQGRITVKVINHLDDEVMKVFRV